MLWEFSAEENDGVDSADQTMGYLAENILIGSYHGQTDSECYGFVWVSNMKTLFQIPDLPLMCSCPWGSPELLFFGVFPQYNKQLTYWLP